MPETTITRVEWGTLEGTRPRHAGKNARLGDHGSTVRVPLARVTASDGATGIGRSTTATPEAADALIGQPLAAVFDVGSGTTPPHRAWDFALWDLVARRASRPVYALASEVNRPQATGPVRVPCYDTSLYFDDLHLTNDDAAAALIAQEARTGYERGHRAFKIKVGRGGRHMELEAGTRRDIAVVRAVHEAVGSACPLMLDANNGYNLNLTRRVLTETADCGIYWMEEAFHEDPALYAELRGWLEREGLPVLIADGEGDASPRLMEWAREGIVDVVQYDIFGHGFTRWLETGRLLDGWGRRSAPHHYGAFWGNFVTGHLAPAVRGFQWAEWDEATVPGVDSSAYTVDDGFVTLPDAPGFALTVDDGAFRRAVETTGFVRG